MDSTFHALGHIVLYGLPTFFLVLLLNFYLKATYFAPLEKTLQQRYEKTEGARIAADESLKAADRRIAEYQAKLRDARSEVYSTQEAAHRKISDQQTVAIATERKHAEQLILQSRERLAVEKEAAFETLAHRADDLADRIAQAILKGKAA